MTLCYTWIIPTKKQDLASITWTRGDFFRSIYALVSWKTTCTLYPWITMLLSSLPLAVLSKQDIIAYTLEMRVKSSIFFKSLINHFQTSHTTEVRIAFNSKSGYGNVLYKQIFSFLNWMTFQYQDFSCIFFFTLFSIWCDSWHLGMQLFYTGLCQVLSGLNTGVSHIRKLPSMGTACLQPFILAWGLSDSL